MIGNWFRKRSLTARDKLIVLAVRKLSAEPVLGRLARFSPVKSYDFATKLEVVSGRGVEPEVCKGEGLRFSLAGAA